MTSRDDGNSLLETEVPNYKALIYHRMDAPHITVR